MSELRLSFNLIFSQRDLGKNTRYASKWTEIPAVVGMRVLCEAMVLAVEVPEFIWMQKAEAFPKNPTVVIYCMCSNTAHAPVSACTTGLLRQPLLISLFSVTKN